MLRPTSQLPSSSLFAADVHQLTTEERARLSYRRAAAIAACYKLSAADIFTLSPQFWAMHTDPISCLDGAATTLLTIQYNLVAGTLLQCAESQDRPDLLPCVQRLLSYELIGQFLLTELQHGLDITHMETTATLTVAGDFDLHTPHAGAAKWMPPTIPCGKPCVGIVFARLVVQDEFRGIRPFLVQLNDGEQMCEGITAKLAPPRGGSNPVNHSLTFFNHVRVPKASLLGNLESDTSPLSFFASIWRVAVGTIALGSIAVPALQISSVIAARYSMHRSVVGSDGVLRPILSFRTQQIPVLTSIAYAYVMQAFQAKAVRLFCDADSDPRVRHGIATSLKAVMVQLSQAAHISLSERLGAQGLFNYNQISNQFSEMRGIAIAEGDILGLSIRLATELLLERYELPSAVHAGCLAARETGLLTENKLLLAEFGHHRTDGFERLILPQCQSIVEAIGHRIAYDAAVDAGVLPCLIELYETGVIKLDLAWYVERGMISRRAFMERENSAMSKALPHLNDLVKNFGVDAYVSAPIVSERAWERFICGWPTYGAKTMLPSDDRHLEADYPLARL